MFEDIPCEKSLGLEPSLPRPVPSRLWYTVPRAFMFEDKPCEKSLGLEPSLRAGSLYAYGILCLGPLCLRTYHVRSPWPGAVPSGRFPLRLWYTVPRAFMFEDIPCEKSLGLEPSSGPVPL